MKTICCLLVSALIFSAPIVGMKSACASDMGYKERQSVQTCALPKKEDLRLDSVNDFAGGQVYKYTQIYDGMEVYGNDITVVRTFDGDEHVYGDRIAIPSLKQNISLEQAIDKVDGEVDSAVAKVYALDREPTLAYELSTDKQKIFISADTGEILRTVPVAYNVQKTMVDAFDNEVTLDIEYNSLTGIYRFEDNIRNIHAVNAKNGQDLTKATDYTNRTGVFEPIAVSAFNSMVKAYDYYVDANNIGVSRRGIGGNDDDIPSNYEQNGEVPVFIIMHYGTNFENAACTFMREDNTALMLVGDGNEDGMIYQPGKALDVLAHEYQHAITNVTADFEYDGDSGALNEAFSDIFGALVEGYEPSDERFWTIGEDTATPRYGNIRSMIGGTRGQRYSVKDKFVCPYPWHRAGHNENCDNNGVHFNSTIITHVQYELCQSRPEFFTREKIGTLWYTTLLSLSSNATFEDFATHFLQAAIDLDFPEDITEEIKNTLIDDDLMESGKVFTVTFVDYDGSVLGSATVKDGDPIDRSQFPAPPERQATERYDYEFAGWDEPDVITSDITLQARYNEILHTFEVCLVNMSGKIIEYRTYGYGEAIDTSAFAVPEPPGNNFVFDDWYTDMEFTTKVQGIVVTQDIVVYARWIDENKSSGCGAITLFDTGGFMGGGLIVAVAATALLTLGHSKSRRKDRRRA